MSISGNRDASAGFRRGTVIYLGVSAFCGFFSFVYDKFAHGVHSPYMTWLFAWPLCLGAVSGVAFWKIRGLPKPERISVNLWNSGAAALTVSSLLRGIFEIAGTASWYQIRLMNAGVTMLVLAGIAYLFRR